MNTKLLTYLSTALLISTSSLPAANIAWVSFHTADNTPNAGASTLTFTNAPDVGYTKLLAANGHTVQRFQTVDNIDTAMLPDGITPVLSAINTNDLVIISRAAASGHYQQANETAAWNGITKPVMLLSGFITRGGTGGGGRLGFVTGEATADVNSNPMRLRVNAVGHPIFAGIALNSTNLMVNPYSQRVTFTNTVTGVTTLQVGISCNNNTIIAGGTVLAAVGTPGDAAANLMVIGEFPAGVTVNHAGTASPVNEVLAGRRLMFLSGSREASPVTADGSGIYDLQPDGAAMFLNAVTYLTTPQAPKCTVPLVGATNLVPGDAWTFSAGVIGDSPLTYQWYQNGLPLAGANGPGLALTGLDPTNAGVYQLYVTNNVGWATSSVAQLSFHSFSPASITNSIISYWPLDGISGPKTLDLVSSYDMTLVNVSAANIFPGKWGNAFYFNGTNSHLERLNAVGDALPIYQHPDFTVSGWVNGTVAPGINVDRRVYAEGSTTNTNPMFDFGTSSAGTDGSVDLFIRSDGNVTATDHRRSTAQAYDGNWHNVVYVQRDVGNGNMRAQLWVDGVLDPVVVAPIRPITANTTAIGALRRAGVSAWFIGMVDEVAVWNRALSPDEIGILQVTQITNPPVRIQPLAINSFKGDLPAVVTGGSVTLRWDVSKDATQVTISGVGDVTGLTSVGLGSQVVSPAQTTNYVITVTRGVDSLSRTTSVSVVTGVAAGWTLLDNFEQAQLGNLSASGYWNDTSGAAGQVVSVYGSKVVRPLNTGAGVAFLNLRGLSVLENQARTLFFRLIPGTNTPANVTNIVGLTDKTQRSYDDARANIGSVLYVAPFTNSSIAVETNGWYLGARNGVGAAVDYIGNQPTPQPAFEAGEVYNVWVDITNTPLADQLSDTFSVYVQKEGGAPRALLFQDYISDRDLFLIDPVLGSITPNLDKLIVIGNGATVSALFDDFYLSTSGYNSTVPKPSGFVIPPGPLGIIWSGSQLQISWTHGVLQSSTDVNGTFVDVPGSPTSPYLVTPTGVSTFYRSRN